MKDYIATSILLFLAGFFQGVVRDCFNGFMAGLDVAHLTGDDVLIALLMVPIILDRKWLRFEQKEGE